MDLPIFKPKKKNYRLCSVKQFVGNGNIQIDRKTIHFSSKSVEVEVEMENGDVFRLYCDNFVSNGIKMLTIDEKFLLYEELEFESNIPFFKINCCVHCLDGNLLIKFDENAFEYGEDCYDYYPTIEPDDERFSNLNFLILCSISDYIKNEGSFYQNKFDHREFVLIRFDNDPSPVRILCSQELEFQLRNGKNPKDLLNHFIGIYKSDYGERYLRIFDNSNIERQTWHRYTATLFIIQEVMENPYRYSFENVEFEEFNYIKIN